MRNIPLSLFTFFFGVVFLGVGVIIFAPSYGLVRSGKVAAGKIVDVKKSLGIDSNQPDYAPIIEFSTPDGQAHQFTSGLNTGTRPIIGTPISVLYDPNKPDHAIINTFFQVYGFPGIFAGVGVLVALIGFIVSFFVPSAQLRSR